MDGSGGWALVQGVLITAAIVLPVVFRDSGSPTAVVAVEVVLLVLRAGVAFAGVVALRGKLTPFPRPGARARLVRHGVYAWIRAWNCASTSALRK